MKIRYTERPLYSAVAAFAFTAAGPLSMSALAADDFKEKGGIEEIIVTAQKREQSIMETQLSVSAVDGASLEDIGATRLADFITSVPGVNLNNFSDGSVFIQLRGSSGLVGDTPVGYYIDDLPYTGVAGDAQLPDILPFDLERVEVLRGPQGTLYGAGASGGVVRVLTQKPELDTFGGRIDASFGTVKGADTDHHLLGAVNIPLVENKLALRVAGGVLGRSGYVDTFHEENANDVDQYFIRNRLRYSASENFEVNLTYWKQDLETNGAIGSDEDYLRYAETPEVRDVSFELYGGTIDWSLGGVHIFSSTNYIELLRREDTATNAGVVTFPNYLYNLLTNKTFNQEIRIISDNDSNFQWTIGGLYTDIDFNAYFEVPYGFPGAFVIDTDVSSERYAVYGEGTLALMEDKLELTAGLRYFEDDRSSVDPVTAPGLDPALAAKFDRMTVRANAAWNYDNGLVYINYAQGFRSGVLNNPAFLGLIPLGVLKPYANEEFVESYEIGAKFVLLDGDLNTEFVLYMNDFEDIQLVNRQEIEISPGFTISAGGFDNVATARAVGFEFVVSYTGIEGLSLSLSGNINSSDYTDDAPGAGIEDGDRIQYITNVSVSGAADYRVSVGSGLDLVLHGDWRYRGDTSDYVSNDAFPEGFSADSDSQFFLNARAGLEKGAWGVYLFADNLTDENGASQVLASRESEFVELPGSQEAVRPRPRTIGLNLKYQF